MKIIVYLVFLYSSLTFWRKYIELSTENDFFHSSFPSTLGASTFTAGYGVVKSEIYVWAAPQHGQNSSAPAELSHVLLGKV